MAHGFYLKSLYTTTSEISLTPNPRMMKTLCSLHDQMSSHRYIPMSYAHVQQEQWQEHQQWRVDHQGQEHHEVQQQLVPVQVIYCM